MSSAAVRAAVTAWFRGATIKGLNKVHSAPPYWADGSEWNLTSKKGGAIAAVHLVEDSEGRITVPAITGQKSRTYTVGLMLFYQYLLGQTVPDEDAWAAWADPLDVIIDGCVARIRQDPNFGNPDVIWQAGQDDNDVHIVRDIPRWLPGKVLSWNVIEFKVIEITTA